MFLFTDAIVNDRPIKVFNHGNIDRAFTYIVDIVEGVVRIIEKSPENRIKTNEYYKLYNIGNKNPVKFLDFIKENEKNTTASKWKLAMLPSGVERTWAYLKIITINYSPF